MNRPRIARCLACFALLLAVLTSLLGSSAVLAAEEECNGSAPPSEKELESGEPPLEVSCEFPVIEGVAGDIFEFKVFLMPMAKEYAGKWNLNLITPSGWEATLWEIHRDQQVTSIDFCGERANSDYVKVKASSLPDESPEPGEYAITLEVESADLKMSIDLTAVVTAEYGFDMDTTTGRLNTEVNGSSEKHIPILLENTGASPIGDIIFSSDKPEGWSITFNPKKIDIIEPDVKRELDVVIKPSKRTVAQDYFITLKAESEYVSDSLALRVTVLTPRIWRWAGIGTAAAVIVGLGVLFSRLRMR